MDTRQTDDGRQDRFEDDGASQRGGSQGRGSERRMTRSSQAGTEMAPQGDRGSGNWQGYVVPYRYYGPGYRGVGYYSVFYQGSGEESDEAEWSEGPGAQEQEQGTAAGRSGGYGGQRAGGGRGHGAGGHGFSGRGPKGYQRSDERIREEVNDQLMADDRIDATDIEVEVQNGEVTLSGTVFDRWTKRRAEDLVEGVMGVREVMNQIRVNQGETQATQQSGRSAEAGQSGGTTESTGSTSRTSSGSSQEPGDQTQGGSNGRRQKAGSTPR